ncbi:MAG: hypothetical protein K0S29_484 [Gammaproteobacteria bacterium]|nr:hypothetical protein [Gammaproteobacteria bacterium]
MPQKTTTTFAISPWLSRYTGLVEVWDNFCKEQMKALPEAARRTLEQRIEESFGGMADKSHFAEVLAEYRRDVENYDSMPDKAKLSKNPDIENKRELLAWAEIHALLRKLPYELQDRDYRNIQEAKEQAKTIPKSSKFYAEAEKIYQDMEAISETIRKAAKIEALVSLAPTSHEKKQQTSWFSELFNRAPAEEAPAPAQPASSASEKPQPSIQASLNTQAQAEPTRRHAATEQQRARTIAAGSPGTFSPTSQTAPPFSPPATPTPQPQAAPAAGGAGRMPAEEKHEEEERPEVKSKKITSYQAFGVLGFSPLVPPNAKKVRKAFDEMELSTDSEKFLDELWDALKGFYTAHHRLSLEKALNGSMLDPSKMLSEVKAAFHKKARETHPDKSSEQKDGMFTKIKEASDLLKTYYEEVKLNQASLSKSHNMLDQAPNRKTLPEVEMADEMATRMLAVSRAQQILFASIPQDQSLRKVYKIKKIAANQEQLIQLRQAYLILKYCNGPSIVDDKTRKYLIQQLVPETIILPEVADLAQTVFMPPPPSSLPAYAHITASSPTK